ncbi:unnamed protein product [Cuscuta europaea]|uniref:Uncharacterized protein n=1 Tax=Cuscuta europaea TaxID=41803 RepID=A0A9P1EC61_CUSEU|nr:unnamed protein product [Cuscuta europaea]
MHVVRDMFQGYEKLSCEVVNYSKSSMSFSLNVSEPDKQMCCQILGIPREGGQSKYLGLPALVGKNKMIILGYLRDRIHSRLKSWNDRFVSRVGTTVLLKNVVQTMPSYAMNVFLLPKELCDDIEKVMNEFLWRGSKFDKKGLRWRSWKGLCMPKEVGGLGFRRLREFNLAMLGKQGWRLITDESCLMSRVLKARYFPNTNFLNAKLGNNPSFIWRSIFETQELQKNNTRRRVGNGVDVQVWADAWLPGQGSGKISSIRRRSVRDMNVAALHDITGKKWNVDKICSLFNEEDKKLILSIPISAQDRKDGYWWKGETNGLYSVKSRYRLLMGEFQADGWK